MQAYSLFSTNNKQLCNTYKPYRLTFVERLSCFLCPINIQIDTVPFRHYCIIAIYNMFKLTKFWHKRLEFLHHNFSTFKSKLNKIKCGTPTLTLSEFISTSVKRPFIKPVFFTTYNTIYDKSYHFCQHRIERKIVSNDCKMPQKTYSYDNYNSTIVSV